MICLLNTATGNFKMKKGVFEKETAPQAKTETWRIQVKVVDDDVLYEVNGLVYRFSHSDISEKYDKLHFKIIFDEKCSVEATSNAVKSNEDIIRE